MDLSTRQRETTRVTAEEIINEWRKGRISAHLRDLMLRAEGYELKKDHKR